MKSIASIVLLLIYLFMPLTVVMAQEEADPVYVPLISEVYPSPSAGEEEWVELYNPYDTEIVLEGNIIHDKVIENKCVATSKIITGITLDPQSYKSIPSGMLAATLNNSGDNIYLCDKELNILLTLTYPQTSSSVSYGLNKDNGEYAFCKVPSPNAENVFQILELIDILNARSQPLDSLIYTTGIVNVEPNKLLENSFYIQSQNAGLKVELPDSSDISIHSGDQINVKGKLKESYSELKIVVEKNEDITILSSANAPIPTILNQDHFVDLEILEGMLVYTEGLITANYSTSFDVSSPGGIVKVNIKTLTGIEVEKSKGDYSKVTGVLSQYNEDYRILPRYLSDLLIIPKTEETANKKTTSVATPKEKVPPKAEEVQGVATTTNLTQTNISLDTILFTNYSHVSKSTQPLLLAGICFVGFMICSYLFIKDFKSLKKFFSLVKKPYYSPRYFRGRKKT